MRSLTRNRLLALALSLTALATVACGKEGSSTNAGPSTTTGGSTPGSTAAPAAANAVASSFVLGGPPECPSRPFCQKGLVDTYGLKFKEFKPLDPGGPLTVAALKNGDIQVGLIFTTDGAIKANGWVLLEDDKKLQPSDNVTPIVNNDIVKAYGKDLSDLVDKVSAKITTADLTDLNKQVDADKKDADAVAKAWVEKNAPGGGTQEKSGPTIVVGSADFTESAVLAEIYAQVLTNNGYKVEKKLKVGSREIYFPALEKGEISFVPDYAGTLLVFVDKNQAASTDAAKTYAALTKALSGKTVTAFTSAPAEDKNGFVVTKETADKYKLVKLSDLAKPAS